jgi:dTDP-4-amino-4,6-dideoxygalactose transaminase
LVETPFDNEHEYCVYHNFVIQVAERERLMDYLASVGVETKIHYPIQLHLQPAAVALGYEEGDFPVAERISTKMMSLPIYPELHDDEVSYIVNCIRNFYN